MQKFPIKSSWFKFCLQTWNPENLAWLPILQKMLHAAISWKCWSVRALNRNNRSFSPNSTLKGLGIVKGGGESLPLSMKGPMHHPMHHLWPPLLSVLSQEGKIKELPLMSETIHILASLEKKGTFKIREGNETTKQYCYNLNNNRLQHVKAQNYLFHFPPLCFHWLHTIPLLPIIEDGVSAKAT